ncbi:MAG: penicillin-binding transpeptidase domain-containing protein [Gammaproteobacteria bacterium]|nr:penicillin-binding transpeptidase domain-containing protein [Gammaproteobacteria bacterium]
MDAETRDRWQETLEGTPAYGGQIPALVTALDADGVDALLADGEIVRVPLEAMRWARPWLTVNSRGRRPETPADILERGQLIRLQRGEEGWALGSCRTSRGRWSHCGPRTARSRPWWAATTSRRTSSTMPCRRPASRAPASSRSSIRRRSTPAGPRHPSIWMPRWCSGMRTWRVLYRPKNDSGDFAGPTRLRRALYRSVNLVSMRILLDVGVDRVIDYVTRFGFDTRTFPRNLQLAIGGGTMALTPMEMARAFAVFANGGFRIEPWLIDRITRDGEGEIFVARPAVACDASCEARRASPEVVAPPRPGEEPGVDPLEQAPRVLEERLAYIMHAMLGDVIQYGTGRRARSLERADLGGKTGTTNEADTWFSGYQRSLAATVWVGFSNNRPVGDNEFGSSTALPIWIELMETALEDVPEYVPQQPPGLVRMRIDPDTGLPAAPDDPDAIVELFREENAPAPASGQDDKDVRPETIF